MKTENIPAYLIVCMTLLAMIQSDWYLFAAYGFLISVFAQIIPPRTISLTKKGE